MVFDTTGLQGGQYKVEARLSGEEASKLGSSSNTILLVNIIDRQKELHVTSPLTQSTAVALLIEGTIDKIGNRGVELTILGPPGTVFGPQFIATKSKPGPEDVQKEGSFSQRVIAPEPGNYFASFRDANGYIGSVTFVVTGPIAATQSETSFPTTTLPATTPEPTRSPAPLLSFAGALVLSCAVAGYFIRNNREKK